MHKTTSTFVIFRGGFLSWQGFIGEKYGIPEKMVSQIAGRVVCFPVYRFFQAEAFLVSSDAQGLWYACVDRWPVRRFCYSLSDYRSFGFSI